MNMDAIKAREKRVQFHRFLLFFFIDDRHHIKDGK